MDTVKDERQRFIGGSDIPVIMGISPFRTRFELAYEKAGLCKSGFAGNDYTEYGNVLEPKIRDYFNQEWGVNCQPDCVTKDDLRGNADGWDSEKKILLEIKTSSEKSVKPMYRAQASFYAHLYGATTMVIAVYERPEDFDTNFDEKRLSVEAYEPTEWLSKEYLVTIINDFRQDVEYLKEYPFATDEDLPSRHGLLPVAKKLLKLDNDLAMYKTIEHEYKEIKSELKNAMEQRNIKSWTMDGGTKITLVPAGADKMVKVLDEDKFKSDHPEMYEKYLTDKIRKGRTGYLRITRHV